MRGCVPRFREGQRLCPSWRFRGGFGPISGQASGRGPRGDEEQEKALALLLRLGGHFRPQCGRFQRTGLTLFPVAKTAIDAVFGKTGEYPRC